MACFLGASPFGSAARRAPTDPNAPKVTWRKGPTHISDEDETPRQDPSLLFQLSLSKGDPKALNNPSREPQEPDADGEDMTKKEKEKKEEEEKEAEKPLMKFREEEKCSGFRKLRNGERSEQKDGGRREGGGEEGKEGRRRKGGGEDS